MNSGADGKRIKPYVSEVSTTIILLLLHMFLMSSAAMVASAVKPATIMLFATMAPMGALPLSFIPVG